MNLYNRNPICMDDEDNPETPEMPSMEKMMSGWQ